MPGAQPRRSTAGRLFSSVERGANVTTGTPGVRKTFRAIVPPVEETVWITPPPVVVEGYAGGSLRSSTDASTAIAYAGTGTTPTYATSTPDSLLDHKEAPDTPYTHIWEGIFKVSKQNVLDSGPAVYTLPPGAIEHPDDQWLIIGDVHVIGALYYQVDFRIGGDTRTVAVRLIDADTAYDPLATPDTPWLTPADIAAGSVEFSASLTAVGSPAFTDAAFFDLVVEFGGTYETANYLVSLEPNFPDGTVIDVYIRAFGATGAHDGVIDTSPASPHWEAVLQPPRYRIPAVTSSLWSSATHFYYADAGLWLGGDFTDLAGYPTALPVDCGQLDFAILPSGTDPAAEDFYYTGPYADYNIYNAPPITNDHFDSGDANAGAGAHLWVLWHGPAGLVASDPAPSTADPMSLVPAVLAADGTA